MTKENIIDISELLEERNNATQKAETPIEDTTANDSQNTINSSSNTSNADTPEQKETIMD